MSRPRRIAFAALGATATVAALAPVALGASLSVPATAAVGAKVTVHASNLVAGRYQLFLAYTAKQPQGGQAVNCLASIGPVRTVHRSLTFTGTVPSKLACREPSGAFIKSVPVSSGRYDLAVFSPVGPNSTDGSKSFVQQPIQITG